MLLLLALSCAVPDERSGQSPIEVHLVVHIDPLIRRGDEGCETALVSNCGELSPEPWQARVENLGWLSERWVETGRAMDLQWGPEMAHVLTEDEEHLASLEAGYAENGEASPRARVDEWVAHGQQAVSAALEAGVASQSAHVHTVMRDASGMWGTGLLTNEGVHPCDAWDGDPLSEAPAEVVESVVHYGAEGAARMVRAFGEPLRAFTGAVPRVLSNKSLSLSDPDALDPSVDREFPAEWTPWMLGGAYSECMMRATGHPPFELYRSAEEHSLSTGEGPLVHPGEPVIGNMAEHLRMPGDGLPGAMMRRLLTAMLAWRHAALLDAPDRPWAYSAHTHLFHLYDGAVPANDPEGRDVSAVTGGRFRGDTEAVAAFIDRFEAGPWQGLRSSEGGGPLRWALPGERGEVETTFTFGELDAAPPAELDERYPYLPLVAERLDESSLVCMGQIDETQVFGLDRCPAGWAWGGDAAGFHCADLSAPERLYLLVPPASACLGLGALVAEAAAVSASRLGSPPRCEGGLAVPMEGLLVEPLPGSSSPGAERLFTACADALMPEG